MTILAYVQRVRFDAAIILNLAISAQAYVCNVCRVSTYVCKYNANTLLTGFVIYGLCLKSKIAGYLSWSNKCGTK